MKSLLWIGDAACASGFGRAADQILKILSALFKVSVIGVNFNGDHRVDHHRPYDIYPAWPGNDALGIGRLAEVLDRAKPDVIVMQTNPWLAPVYGRAIQKHQGHAKTPLVGIIAVEGKNCVGKHLNGLTKAIFWTQFGRNEALRGGMRKTMPTDVIPLGVDTDVFKPGDRVAARRKLGLAEVPEDAFIVLNVNRNQARKRLDLSILYFAEWINSRTIRDAYLYLHVLPGSTVALDCDQLAFYCGVEDRLILADPKDKFNGAPEEYVVAANQAANAYLTTTLGEGFGLTAFEAAASALPVIAGNYAALGEYGLGSFMLTECDSEGVMPDVHGMIGAAPRKDEVILALDELYRNPYSRALYGEKSLRLATQPQFNWMNIAQRFAKTIETAC